MTSSAKAAANPARFAAAPAADAIFPTLYTLKKALLSPRTRYLRRKEQLPAGFLRSAIELHYYRPAFYRWLAAIAKDDELLYQARLDTDSVVLDVGAYNGSWSRAIEERYDPRIVAFEPDPGNHSKLVATAGKLSKVSIYQWGLSDSNRRATLSRQGPGSTIYNSDVIEAGAPTVDIELRDVYDVWSALGLDQVDLMKINIEGGEFALLERMRDTDLLKNVACYLIQFHEWHPRAYRRRRQLHRALSRTHQRVWDYHFIWEKWERIPQENDPRMV